MPINFKTTKFAQRAQKDPLLYEMLRDIGLTGNELAGAHDTLAASSAASIAAIEAKLTDGDKGDITVTNDFATWTIDNDAVTYAKIQNVSATDRLLGRSTAGAGDVEEISLGTGFSVSGGTLTFTGGKIMRAQEFTSGATVFTTAAGVTEVWVTGCGAGGGCGGEETDTAHGGVGGGGGGESVFRKKLTVTASTGYTVTIGTGGTAGASSSTAGSVTAGSAGGATSFGGLLTLAGGLGSGGVTGTTTGIGAAAGGPGGTSGANGFPPITGASGTTAVNGAPGVSFPGGWGTGGYHGAASGMRAGRSGYLLVEWNE